jgi:hypothetical protein
MKVQRVKIDTDHYIWLVLDDNCLPIEPIESFIRFLHITDKSSETLQTYATHLKLFWEFLNGTGKDWNKIKISDLAEFIYWLRTKTTNIMCITNNKDCLRSERTVNIILSALSSFYRYHNQVGNTSLIFTEPHFLPHNRHRSFLYHVFKNKPTLKKIIGLKAALTYQP